MNQNLIAWLTLASVIVNNAHRVPGMGAVTAAVPMPVQTFASFAAPIGAGMLALGVIRK